MSLYQVAALAKGAEAYREDEEERDRRADAKRGVALQRAAKEKMKRGKAI